MTLYEKVLLYDRMSAEDVDRIRKACENMEVSLKIISPSEYKVPVGFLAYGTEDQIREYLTETDPSAAFERPMLLLAGFTNDRLHKILDEMSSQGAAPIALKAVLTEYNATWDSLSLYEELKKEDEYMRSSP